MFIDSESPIAAMKVMSIQPHITLVRQYWLSALETIWSALPEGSAATYSRISGILRGASEWA